MARGSSSWSSSAAMKKKRKEKAEEEEADDGKMAEVRHRKRLKSLAISNNLVSEVPAKPRAPLAPSEALMKHHGRDIVKKSQQRKNLRFLFSLPGLLAPMGGGQIGELKDLGTNNPVLYLDFGAGRIKLFGTIVFPTNRYLTMHFPSSKSKGATATGKSVLCDDYFDNMIVFSDAWWIGTKDDNPEETKLDFPKEFTRGQHAEFDFKGGAGSMPVPVNKQSHHKDETAFLQEPSPNGKVEDKLPDEGNKDLTAATPVRHSARTSGKRFNFGEASSGDDSEDDYVESDN